MKGKLISLEGCEGVGKSTQIEMLKQYLENSKCDALFLREPGGTEISEKIRDIILSIDSKNMNSRCEALLYSASRAQLIGQVIRPALEEGKLVVCDRFIDSTFAYQGIARGLGADYITTLNEAACDGILPELTIFLDLDPSTAFARKGGADKNDRMEMENMDFHKRVYDGYQQAIASSNGRIISVESKDSAYQIHKNIIEILRQHNIIE
ncbi:MAG: dTMP kinase [Clostridia bacterium]